jgi:hypothetical protein
MATQTLEAMLSHSATLIPLEQNLAVQISTKRLP